MFAIISDGTVHEYPIHSIHQRFPQTSFPDPMVDSALPDGVVRVAISAVPSYDPYTHRLVEEAPAYEDGQWLVRHSVVPLGEDELAAIRADRAAVVRSNRTRLLQQSDWTQLADAPVDSQTWATYRQALRDITAQAGFPFDVMWPTAP